MNKILRYSLAVFFIGLGLYFLLPLVIGVRHIGMFAPAAVFGIFAWILLRPQKVKALLTGRHRALWRTLLALFAAGLLCVDVILGLMVRQAVNRPESDAPCTVLVLGCEIRGLRPSKMLQARIDSAYAYLTANPRAVCVACGGDPGRIYLEEESENTRQNIAFAADIIEENGLPTEIAVASDNFHQLRSSIYAKKSGLSAYSLGCRSYWLLGPGYWARETIAVAAALTLGR